MIFEFKNKPTIMIHDIYRLIIGTVTGSFAALYNLDLLQIQFPFYEIVNFHLGIANSLLGLLIGAVTLRYLLLQIKKIRRDLAEKKKINK